MLAVRPFEGGGRGMYFDLSYILRHTFIYRELKYEIQIIATVIAVFRGCEV